MKPLRIAVLPGDGIGREVTEAVLPVFERLALGTEIAVGDIGWECWKAEGDPVPRRTWDLIAGADCVLLGAITSKPHAQALAELAPELRGAGLSYVSPVIQLRQRLDLFVNVRPVYSIPGNPRQLSPAMNLAVLRENTEGLYAGFDYHPLPPALHGFVRDHRPPASGWQLDDADDGAAAIRLVTRRGLSRLFEFAFRWARDHGYPRVTWSDKPNVLRRSGQFALDLLEATARRYPDVPWEVQNVDATAMWMVRDPSRFGVIVAENQFGDILSDLGAGLMGGLGLAPSANIGVTRSYFEPVHGSAPRHAGKGIANPAAMFLTVAMMLEQHGHAAAGGAIRRAVAATITDGRTLTYDLGGSAGTRDMAAAILSRIEH